MTAKNSPPESPLVLRIVRVFAAPRALVFDAWTKPEHLKRWSSPHGFTMPVSEGELRPGGKWRACMVRPDGEELWLGGEYLEVVPNERLVFTHSWDEDGGTAPVTVVTVVFADHPQGTQITFEQTGFGSPESRDGHSGGWDECFDRLSALLAQVSA